MRARSWRPRCGQRSAKGLWANDSSRLWDFFGDALRSGAFCDDRAANNVEIQRSLSRSSFSFMLISTIFP